MQMGSIYAAADVTIIAAAGSHADHGISGFCSESPRTLRQERVGEIHLRLIPQQGLWWSIEESIWMSRAWTFQEGFFSRRRLTFTDKEVFYLCNSALGDERECKLSLHGKDLHESGLMNALVPQWSSARTQDVLGRAKQLPEHYSTRQLSYNSDALNAIAGALNALILWVCSISGVYRSASTSWRPSASSLATREFFENNLRCYGTTLHPAADGMAFLVGHR